jgi:hypothetical protein
MEVVEEDGEVVEERARTAAAYHLTTTEAMDSPGSGTTPATQETRGGRGNMVDLGPKVEEEASGWQ